VVLDVVNTFFGTSSGVHVIFVFSRLLVVSPHFVSPPLSRLTLLLVRRVDCPRFPVCTLAVRSFPFSCGNPGGYSRTSSDCRFCCSCFPLFFACLELSLISLRVRPAVFFFFQLVFDASLTLVPGRLVKLGPPLIRSASLIRPP